MCISLYVRVCESVHMCAGARVCAGTHTTTVVVFLSGIMNHKTMIFWGGGALSALKIVYLVTEIWVENRFSLHSEDVILSSTNCD